MRATSRIKIFQPAEMERAGVERRVHLLNISLGGALVYADSAPEPGEEIRLTSGIPLGTARVQWCSGQRFGVAFRNPLSPEQLAAIVRHAGDVARMALPPIR